jgi:hypothetical protein
MIAVQTLKVRIVIHRPGRVVAFWPGHRRRFLRTGDRRHQQHQGEREQGFIHSRLLIEGEAPGPLSPAAGLLRHRASRWDDGPGAASGATFAFGAVPVNRVGQARQHEAQPQDDFEHQAAPDQGHSPALVKGRTASGAVLRVGERPLLFGVIYGLLALQPGDCFLVVVWVHQAMVLTDGFHDRLLG